MTIAQITGRTLKLTIVSRIHILILNNKMPIISGSDFTTMENLWRINLFR